MREALTQVLLFIAETKNTEIVFGTFSASQKQMEDVEALVHEIIQEKIQTDNLEKRNRLWRCGKSFRRKPRAGTTFSICQYE